MKSTSLKILKLLEKRGEVTLKEAVRSMGSIYNDHRDYYILANMIKANLVSMYLESDGRPIREMNERELAITLYMWANCGSDGSYKGMTVSGADFGEEFVYITAEGEFILENLARTRSERIWGLFAGIVIAVVAAFATKYLS